MSILQTTALIAGGSAVMGAGAAAGRDVYQGVKRNIGLEPLSFWQASPAPLTIGPSAPSTE